MARAWAARMPSKRTAEGSPPCLVLIISTPRALAPHLKLLDGRGTEGVGSSQQNGLALAAVIRCQLPRRRGFAGAVHAHHHDDPGWRCVFGLEEVLFFAGVQNGLDLLLQ